MSYLTYFAEAVVSERRAQTAEHARGYQLRHAVPRRSRRWTWLVARSARTDPTPARTSAAGHEITCARAGGSTSAA